MAVPADRIVERRALSLASLADPARPSGRLAIVLCAVVVALATVMVSAGPAAAVDLSDRIAAVRAAQNSAESLMLQADKTVAQYDAQLKAAKKQLKPLKRAVTQQRSRLATAKGILQTRRDRLAEKGSSLAQASTPPADVRQRLRSIEADIRQAEISRDAAIRAQQAAVRAVWSKKSQIENILNQRKSAISRREGAEASLSTYISQMQTLAAMKVQEQATVSLAERGIFSWPTTGRITQPYGCTGVVYNPRRGPCKHFHDGIDVVDGYGTPIRSIAAGVVSYQGWNPYDQEGRAYVVDVVHADGYVSRYGHLIPGNQVKAGDLVYTGQVIGKMGSTGKSTGTHLHFEVLRGGRDIDPVSLLPAGVVQVDPSSTKAGQAQLKRAAEPTPKPQKPKRTPPPATPFPFAKEAPVATCDDEASRSRGPAVQCEPTGLFAAAAENGPPSVPLPYRGTQIATG